MIFRGYSKLEGRFSCYNLSKYCNKNTVKRGEKA
jgi:hypothetical protein